MAEYELPKKTLAEFKDELKRKVAFEKKDVPETLADPQVQPHRTWQDMISERVLQSYLNSREKK
jgi:hypothetical protein